jgi:hypothetical protein
MDISFVFRKFRKSISGFTILALLATFVSFVGVAQASTFPDTDGHWGEAYIEALADAGVVSGNDDGTFNPDGSIDRAALSKMLVLAFTEGLVDGAENPYSDVSSDDWYVDYAASAYALGIMTGEGDGTFNGAGVVNRATLVQAVYNAAGYASASVEDLPFTDVSSADWSFDAVYHSYWLSVVDGESEDTFNLSGDASRAAASKVIYNGWYPVEREEVVEEDECEDGYEMDDYGDCVEEEDTTSEGTLLMSVASDTPDGADVPSGATSVEVFAVDMTAEDDDVNVDSVTFNQFGVSSLSSTHSAYVYYEDEDGMQVRASSGQSVSTSTHDVTFNNLDIEVEEGETVRMSVRLDVGTVASAGSVGFQVESADMVDADGADVSGDFALMGETFDLSTTAAGTITVEKNGTVNNAQVGEDGAEIAKFKLTSATEAADLQELGIYISGSINTEDMANFELWVSGEDEAIASVDGVDSLDVARFMIEDYEITKGATKSFTVTADFNTGRTDDTVEAYIDEDTDLFAVGGLYGFGMAVTRTLYDGNANSCAASSDNDCSYMTLEGGDVTVTSNGPAASDIAINGDDITLLEFDVVTVTDVTFKNFPISLTVPENVAASGLLSTTTANFTDIKIVDLETGEEIFSAVDSDVFTTAINNATAIDETTGNTDGSPAFHLFTDDWSPEAGSEYSLALMLDVENNTSLASDTVVATLALGTTYPELRDVNNKVLTNSSVLVPASAITAKTHTLRSPSLTLSLASTPVSRTYVKGSEDVPFTGVVFACGEASDCRITDLTVNGALDAESDGYDTAGATPSLNTFVGSIWLEDDEGNVVSGPESVNGTTWNTTFSSIDWSLSGGDTEVLYIMGDISSDAYTGAAAELLAFAITGSTGITVEDSDGNSFTASGSANTGNTTAVTTSDGGTLTVEVDSSTAREDIVVAGTSDVEISTFKFTTVDEAFVVNKLSVNARQSAATTAALGDYDNNVSSITLSYVNSAGESVEKSGFLSNGIADFSGLDFYVDADDDASITLSADLNTISGGAAATEFVDLNLAFNQFEAVAQGSGETYKVEKLSNKATPTSAAISSDTSFLDFGDITWVTSTHDINTTVADLADAGSSQTLVVNDQTDTDPINLPVGTLLCVDADAGTDCDAAEAMLVVTSWTQGSAFTDAGDTGDAVVVTVVDGDSADDALTDGDNIIYALPGTGYMTSAKQMHVYESKPTIAVDSSSPSGTLTVEDSQDVFVFNITADEAEDVKIRAALELSTTATGTTGSPICTPTTDDTAGDHVDAESVICTTAGNTADDTFVFDTGATGVIEDYARANFWFKWTDVAGSSPLWADLSIGTGDTSSATAPGQVTAFDQTSCGGATANILTTEWYNCDLAIPTGTLTADQYFHFVVEDATRIVADDTIHVDQVKLYNEKLTVNISTDTDIDTFANNVTNPDAPVLATLKDGSTNVATGYFSTSTNGASAAPTGAVTFIPTTAIEVDDEGKVFTVETNTRYLLAEDESSDDPVSFSIGLGSSTDGVISTADEGDFWWYETNSTVKWLGEVSSATLTGSTLIY